MVASWRCLSQASVISKPYFFLTAAFGTLF